MEDAARIGMVQRRVAKALPGRNRHGAIYRGDGAWRISRAVLSHERGCGEAHRQSNRDAELSSMEDAKCWDRCYVCTRVQCADVQSAGVDFAIGVRATS